MALLRNRTHAHVWKKFQKFWIQPFGIPNTLIVDQGGELLAVFADQCEKFHIEMKVTAAQTPWQNSMAERHGGLFAEMWNKVTYEFGIKGYDAVGHAVAICVQAKNATTTKHGLSPEQAVFGRALRWVDPASKPDEG